MNIFCDTNIVMEYIQRRKEADLVEKILEFALDEEHGLFISIGSLYTITYLIEGYLKRDLALEKKDRIRELREILNSVLDTFTLSCQHVANMRYAVNDFHFDDLEDSYQAQMAEIMGCDIILTINAKHFSKFADHSSIAVLTPQQFIDNYIDYSLSNA